MVFFHPILIWGSGVVAGKNHEKEAFPGWCSAMRRLVFDRADRPYALVPIANCYKESVIIRLDSFFVRGFEPGE